MTETTAHTATDWVGDRRRFALAWGLPTVVLIAGSLVDSPARTVIWVAALVWMGTACVVNARRCGRTHCRFTGPYYLMMTAPVALYGAGLLALGPYGWWILGGAILFGGKLIWWATEALLGKYSK